jgi:hypothetical protein
LLLRMYENRRLLSMPSLSVESSLMRVLHSMSGPRIQARLRLHSVSQTATSDNLVFRHPYNKALLASSRSPPESSTFASSQRHAQRGDKGDRSW